MCGIGLFMGNLNRKEDYYKLKMLHGFLDTRGGDGSGISLLGDKKVSHMKSADLANKFTATYKLNLKDEFVSISLHARKSSVGASTAANAHPFVLGPWSTKNNEIPKHRFSIVKNGTIDNWRELLKEYNPFEASYVNHITVDSHALGYILFYNSDKAVEILEKYVGGCAFILHHGDQTIVFKGESKEWYTDRMEEERPLYQGTDDLGQTWFASEKWMLEGIDIENIVDVPTNKLLIYENNELVKTIEVDRSKSKRKEWTNHTQGRLTSPYSDYEDLTWPKNDYNKPSTASSFYNRNREVIPVVDTANEKVIENLLKKHKITKLLC